MVHSNNKILGLREKNKKTFEKENFQLNTYCNIYKCKYLFHFNFTKTIKLRRMLQNLIGQEH